MEKSGNGVVAASSPWVATQQPTDGEVEPFERAMLLDGFDGVGRTGGGEPTGRGCQRRDGVSVEIDRQEQQLCEELPDHAFSLSNWMALSIAFSIFENG